MDLEQEIDRLYALPLAEFVPARNDLARQLRQSGERESAERVSKLPKANATAWAINRLWDEARAELEALFAAGEAVRAALEQGTDPASPLADRRRRASDLLSRAESILSTAGHRVTRSASQRLSHTLDALAATGGASEPCPGRLVRDLDPPGFDLLAALDLPPASPPNASRRGKGQRTRKTVTGKKAPRNGRKSARQKAVERARQQLDRAAAAHSKRQAELELATRAAAEARQRRDRLRSELEKAERELRRTERATKSALTAQRRAADKLESAERELDEARSTSTG